MTPGEKTVNERYMPTLGNGHIATTVFSDGIYMDGFYSGVGREHLVRVNQRSFVVEKNVFSDDVVNSV